MLCSGLSKESWSRSCLQQRMHQCWGYHQYGSCITAVLMIVSFICGAVKTVNRSIRVGHSNQHAFLRMSMHLYCQCKYGQAKFKAPRVIMNYLSWQPRSDSKIRGLTSMAETLTRPHSANKNGTCISKAAFENADACSSD